jgi:ankyrin repeat protein
METYKNEQLSKNPNERMKLMDHALQFGNTSDLEALFNQGMDINQTDFQGRTALMMSVVNGKNDVVEMLIRRGADVNCVFMYQDRLPKTALDAARECRKAEIEKILIEHGAKTGSELHQNQ